MIVSVITLSPNMKSSEVSGIITLQEILNKGKLCHKCPSGKANADKSWVKPLKRKHCSLYTAEKFLISITMTCFATVTAGRKKKSSVAQMRKVHKDRLYPAE